MKQVRLTLVASAVSAALSLFAASAHANQAVAAKSAEAAPNLWFVEFAGAPVADGRMASAVKADEAEFLREASSKNIKFKKRNTFSNLFNGVSIEATPAERAKIAKMASVKAMYPVMVINAPKVEKVDGGTVPDMGSALGMTGADIAQNSLGLSGAGIKVGVIDTGIDLDHPAFGGGGVSGGTSFAGHPRIKFGYDFVGDAFNADPTSPAYNPVATPDANPDDCGGHGTHVAGIIGGNSATDNFKGVAPNVTLGAYRVFGCAGSTTSDIILAAMERAKADGMQVINQSLGASFQWPQYPTAQAADRLVRDGIVMVASIGNSGTSGLYAAGAPGVGKDVIGVASYDNVAIKAKSMYAGSDNKAYGFLDATGAAATPATGTFPLARTGTTASLADGCSALAPGSLTGKVALIRRGTCAFYTKAANAQAAGAVGVILYNNAPGFVGASVVGTPALTIPVVGTSDQFGAELDARIAAGSETITWSDTVASFSNSSGNLISSFSSWGLAADLSLKPDLGAPGGLINSSYPLELGGFATLSGTSMSSPHTAGAVALLLEAKPTLKSTQVRDRLQNTAEPKAWSGNPSLGFLDATHRQGAGMVDIVQAIQTKAQVLPGKLSLGESQAGPQVRTLTVKNFSKTAVTYDLTHEGAVATGSNTFAVSIFNTPASVAFSASTITVPAGGSVPVTVTVTAPTDLADKGVYGGYVVVKARGEGGETLRVPYSGFKGDYQSIQVLTPTANGFPWLAQLVGTSYQNRPSGGTYTMVGSDVPYMLMHFDHHARALRVTVKETATGKNWFTAISDDYLPRNSTSTGFYAFAWDGTTSKKNGTVLTVPNGTYTLDVSVLKALGDSTNEAHWEKWASPTVTIQRTPPTK
ncbi:S8 family serine peptidase [Ideonella paludis]|uniref:S8 family serine peptidase n=1 Tax=Ideonella paludis TaxID=1233411 RepID=A0ABS5DTV2_9BURK|nr:S8 family serine peptidase [Ideonella paludis]MBQ0934562.1 S8 family serine peptidase [Ideonella paludis]